MSEVRNPILAGRRVAAGLALLGALAGCSVFKADLGAQAALNERVVGKPMGDFITTYGAPKARGELPDGTVEYEWISSIGRTTNSGYYGLDDRTCELRLVVAKNGRVSEARIYRDMPGRTSTSRCAEVFRAP